MAAAAANGCFCCCICGGLCGPAAVTIIFRRCRRHHHRVECTFRIAHNQLLSCPCMVWPADTHKGNIILLSFEIDTKILLFFFFTRPENEPPNSLLIVNNVFVNGLIDIYKKRFNWGVLKVQKELTDKINYNSV